MDRHAYLFYAPLFFYIRWGRRSGSKGSLFGGHRVKRGQACFAKCFFQAPSDARALDQILACPPAQEHARINTRTRPPARPHARTYTPHTHTHTNIHIFISIHEHTHMPQSE